MFAKLRKAKIRLCSGMKERFPNFDFPFACLKCEVAYIHQFRWFEQVNLVERSLRSVRVKILRCLAKSNRIEEERR